MGRTCGFIKKFAPDRILNLSLRTLRFLGGLPYKWSRYDHQGFVGSPCAEGVIQAPAKGPWSDSVRGAKVRLIPAKMVRSKLLVIWSWGLLLAVVVAVLNLVVFYVLYPDLFISDLHSSTSRAIKSALQHLQSAATVVLLTHLIFRGADLAGMTCRLAALVDLARPSWKFPGDKALCVVTVSLSLNIVFDIILFITMSANAITAIVMNWESGQKVGLSFSLFLNIVLDAVIAAVIVLFYSVCSVLSFVYEETLGVRLDTLSITNPRVRPVGTGPHHPSKPLDVRLWYFPVNSESVTSAAQVAFDLQNFQRVFNNYMSIPITFILMKALMFLIVQVYDLSTEMTLQAIIAFVNMLREVIYLVVLSCAPEGINKQVINQLSDDYISNGWSSFYKVLQMVDYIEDMRMKT